MFLEKTENRRRAINTARIVFTLGGEYTIVPKDVAPSPRIGDMAMAYMVLLDALYQYALGVCFDRFPHGQELETTRDVLASKCHRHPLGDLPIISNAQENGLRFAADGHIVPLSLHRSRLSTLQSQRKTLFLAVEQFAFGDQTTISKQHMLTAAKLAGALGCGLYLHRCTPLYVEYLSEVGSLPPLLMRLPTGKDKNRTLTELASLGAQPLWLVHLNHFLLKLDMVHNIEHAKSRLKILADQLNAIYASATPVAAAA